MINRKQVKTPKWTRTILLTVLAAAVGCTNSEIPDVSNNSPGNQSGKTTIHVDAGHKAANTRVAYDDSQVGAVDGNALTWQEDDRLTVVRMNAGRYEDHKDDYQYKGNPGATSGSFEGTTITADGDSWSVYYPNTVAVNTGDGTVPLPMTGQTQAEDKSTNHLKNYMLLAATELTNLTDGFSLKMQSSIMKFDLSGIPPEVGTLKTLTWSVETASGTSKELTLTFPAAGADGTVVFGNNGKADLTAYLSFLPTEMSLMANGRFNVMLMGDKTYVATIIASASGKAYEAGKRYTATIDNTRSTAEWKEAFVVNTTISTPDTYNYNGLEMQIGTWQSDNSPIQTILATATIAGGKAVFELPSALSADTKVWVCIPRVVKFFHTLTADEVNNNTLTLPDKDAGSTLKASPTADGKAYVNDWIVALYMGVNKDGDASPGATPIYWATGNMIATKTNPANSGTTTVAFHIAKPEETKAEATDGFIPAGITTSSSDGYSACVPGSQWDKFGWGDVTGLKTSESIEDYVSSIIKSGENFSGNAAYDIARARLGGSWRLPAGGYNMDSEFAAFADSNYENLLPDGVNWNDGAYIGRTYTHTILNAGTPNNTIINILAFPTADWREGARLSDRRDTGPYWSGTVESQNDAFYFGYYENTAIRGAASCLYGLAVRPVSE